MRSLFSLLLYVPPLRVFNKVFGIKKFGRFRGVIMHSFGVAIQCQIARCDHAKSWHGNLLVPRPTSCSFQSWLAVRKPGESPHLPQRVKLVLSTSFRKAQRGPHAKRLVFSFCFLPTAAPATILHHDHPLAHEHVVCKESCWKEVNKIRTNKLLLFFFQS